MVGLNRLSVHRRWRCAGHSLATGTVPKRVDNVQARRVLGDVVDKDVEITGEAAVQKNAWSVLLSLV